MVGYRFLALSITGPLRNANEDLRLIKRDIFVAKDLDGVPCSLVLVLHK
jgi:hypothetical protein